MFSEVGTNGNLGVSMSTTKTVKFTAVLSTLFIASFSNAAIIVAGSVEAFNALVAMRSGSILEENFDGYSGFYASGLTGGSGDLAWTATADAGLFAHGSVMSTNNSSVALTMTFSSPNVFAIGGNFFNTSAPNMVMPGLVTVYSGSQVYVLSSNGGSTSFGGFMSTDGSISSITFAPFAIGNTFASASSVVVGVVPSPAVLALGALAGAFGRRRRN